MSKIDIMFILTAVVVLLSVFVHILHRGFNFLESFSIMQGYVLPTGYLLILVYVALVVPIALLITAFVLYRKDKKHELIPLLLTLTLTAASISIIAGGNGLVEYHFSIFMVIAMIASFQNIRMVLYSTILFAFHHFAGYFFFPEILCGTSDYSFSLLMLHAIFLLLTSGATILIITNNNTLQAALAQENEEAEQQLQNILATMRLENDSLTKVAAEIQEESQLNAASSRNIAEAIQKLEVNAQEEAASMHQAIMQNKENLKEIEAMNVKTSSVVLQAKDSLQQANDGITTIQDVTNQMNTITSTISSIDLLIETLAQQSGEITKLLNVIHSISEQTQLLALNASIEAARAGEHGKGFSVVASEIRKLATGTQSSATEIDEVMEAIHQQIQQVATRMNIGVEEVRKGNASIEATESTFNAIVDTISQLEANIEGVAESTKYLTSHTQESMALFEQVAQTNEATVNTIAVISESAQDQKSTVDGINEAIRGLQNISNDMQQLMKQLQ